MTYDEFLKELELTKHNDILQKLEDKPLDFVPARVVWFRNQTKEIGRRKTLDKLTADRRVWCTNTLTGRWDTVTKGIWAFERGPEATLFYLRWKGTLE